MKSLLLSIFFLCAVPVTVHSLKCYQCLGTEEDCKKDKLEADKTKYSVSCPTGTCIRVWGKKDDKTLVAESCGDEAGCETAKKECDNIKDGKCAVGCCNSDYCNAGSSVSFSVFLMTVSSALGLALLK